MSHSMQVKCLILLAVFGLGGADGCPVTMNPPPPGGSTPQSGAAQVNIQGTWALQYDAQRKITIRTANGQVGSLLAAPGQGPISVLSRTLDQTSFCWRVDSICPEQVLLGRTEIAQGGTQLLVAFNRKGPLSNLEQEGLPGTLAGTQVAFPLAMVPDPGDPCTLGQGSAINATAVANSASSQADGGAAAPTPADLMRGEVTLVYAGQCFAQGGSGALYEDDRVELSMRFVATRP